jgi:hypothetical protein
MAFSSSVPEGDRSTHSEIEGGDLISAKPARTGAVSQENGSRSRKSGRLSVALASLAAAVLVLPTAPAIMESLGLQLSAAGQRLTGILAVVVAVIALFIALRELVEKYGESWRPRTKKLFLLCTLAVGAGLLILLAAFYDPYVNLPRMTGTQDVAVLGFVRTDGSGTQPLEDLATDLASRLDGQLPIGQAESYAEVRAPLDRLLEAEGAEIGGWTTEFVERSGADLVFAGVVDDQSGPQIRIRPAIYVSPALVPEAMELSGWTVGPWLPASGGLDSHRGRQSILQAFLHDGVSIARFVNALDAWRVGDLVEADRLMGSVSTESQGLLSVDMLHLFRGHARQLVALNIHTADRQNLLASAAAEYRSIPASSTIAVRARLSLATNEYHQSSGRYCTPTKVNQEGLEHAATELGGIAAQTEIRPAVRLAARVNFAQVLACMRRAELPVNEDEFTRVLADIRAFETVDENLRPLALRAQALGRAIEAEQARRAGREAQALDLIHEAISLSANPRDLGLWWGYISFWEARRCNDSAARSALQQATEQYRVAVSGGRMTQGSFERFVKTAESDLDQVQERCTSHEIRPSQ